ncbi:hypothetical protein LG047_19060 [Methylocystis sp. WRRC1]|uniref:hypothetical protein n=1 Tax=Methylocystis sp. WRRC1 TaxID=1732014 RepID=UPI001D13E6D4|nr:hypothetical protein [Methylocystis sp. WRRC1]MCC3247392.1 hypothetical protein [Methylocystis sp. WRRC1]
MKSTSRITVALLFLVPATASAACTPSPPPLSWTTATEPTPASVPIDPKTIGPLVVVMFRHAEKPIRDDGVMIEDGNLGSEAAGRLSRLPDALLNRFGCPDLLIAANPAVKMINKATGQYFNYVRPLATIAPLSARINFPVWTPYGYNQNESLAHDLLGDRAFAPDVNGKAKTVFIAWERNNIRKLYEQLVRLGNLRELAGNALAVEGEEYKCELPSKWLQCDFDSIWLVHVRNGAICLTHRSENLDDMNFQSRCKGAESVTDAP